MMYASSKGCDQTVQMSRLVCFLLFEYGLAPFFHVEAHAARL